MPLIPKLPVWQAAAGASGSGSPLKLGVHLDEINTAEIACSMFIMISYWKHGTPVPDGSAGANPSLLYGQVPLARRP